MAWRGAARRENKTEKQTYSDLNVIVFLFVFVAFHSCAKSTAGNKQQQNKTKAATSTARHLPPALACSRSASYSHSHTRSLFAVVRPTSLLIRSVF